MERGLEHLFHQSLFKISYFMTGRKVGHSMWIIYFLRNQLLMTLIHWIKKIFFSLAFLKYQITWFTVSSHSYVWEWAWGGGQAGRRADPSVFARQQQTEWQRYLRQSLEVVAKVMELLPTHAFSTLVPHHLGWGGTEGPIISLHIAWRGRLLCSPVLQNVYILNRIIIMITDPWI